MSTMADPEGTRERRPTSSPPALEDNIDSMDCLRSEEDSLADLANAPVESLKRLERGPWPVLEAEGDEATAAVLGADWDVEGGGGRTNWNCCLEVDPARYKPGDAGGGGATKTGAGGAAGGASVWIEIS